MTTKMRIMDAMEFISSIVLMALCTWAIIALGKEVFSYDWQNTIAVAAVGNQLAGSILLCVTGWTQWAIIHGLNKKVTEEEEERV